MLRNGRDNDVCGWDERAGQICPTLVVSLGKVGADSRPFSIRISERWPGFEDWKTPKGFPFHPSTWVTGSHLGNPLLWNALWIEIFFFFPFYLVTFTEINLVQDILPWAKTFSYSEGSALRLSFIFTSFPLCAIQRSMHGEAAVVSWMKPFYQFMSSTVYRKQPVPTSQGLLL